MMMSKQTKKPSIKTLLGGAWTLAMVRETLVAPAVYPTRTVSEMSLEFVVQRAVVAEFFPSSAFLVCRWTYIVFLLLSALDYCLSVV